MDKLAEELASLQSRAAETSVALSEQRRRYIDLQHRILKVLIKQECSRKEGFALQPEEERLRVQLESVHNELSIPTQFRVKLFFVKRNFWKIILLILIAGKVK